MQVFRHGTWYSVCGIQFSEQDGEVVCRELGLGFLGKAFSSWEYGIKFTFQQMKVEDKKGIIVEVHSKPLFSTSIH